jgi:2-succinyl-5-enolpyruvyl-6-hydroxy-3-cyclohexene-1-carboxylate synthase
VIDPDHGVAVDVPASSIGALAGLAAPPTDHSQWTRSWLAATESAENVIAGMLDAQRTLSEPGVARAVAEYLPDGARLVVGSSMPVRDLEWFGGPKAIAHANRGANGIDGVVSTALGVSLRGTPTVALVGDVAFLHDAGALTAIAARGADLRIVVLDNDGGGIFSFLPQATELSVERFEQLFGTPHGSDIVGVAAAHHLDATTVDSTADLARRLDVRGPALTRVVTDRADNVAAHATLTRAVAQAVMGG